MTFCVSCHAIPTEFSTIHPQTNHNGTSVKESVERDEDTRDGSFIGDKARATVEMTGRHRNILVATKHNKTF